MSAVAARRIALLGAESTGKTELALALGAHLRATGRRVAVVPEVLRDWCARAGRAPRPEEQLPIAQAQERHVDDAAGTHDIVIADTTALMVAVYAGMLFEDGALYRFARARLRTYDAILLTGLDLPWVADGLLRDAAHAREPVDALVRDALQQSRIGYQVVYGAGPARLAAALDALRRMGLSAGPATDAGDGDTDGDTDGNGRRWTWSCDTCSDPVCEHKLFTGLRR